MWQKIKNNLLVITTSMYFLFLGFVITNYYLNYKKLIKDFSLGKELFKDSWNEVIWLSIVLTALSALLILAIIKKHKKKILKVLSYFFVPLIFIINIVSIIFFVSNHIYNYPLFASNKQIKQFFTKTSPNFPNLVLGGNVLQASIMFERDKDLIEFFIIRGADVNIENYFGITPLSYAVIEAPPEIVDLLTFSPKLSPKLSRV